MSNVKVINMEDFIDTVGNVDCTAPHMYLDFSDSSVYSAAKQEWQWVNNNNQNNIVIFANHPKCTDDGSREPYIVTSTQFNDTLTRVDFTVEKTASYDDVLNDAELGYHTWYEPDEALLAAVWNQTAEDVKETHVAFEKRGVVERALANETLPALAKTKRDGVSISVNQRFDDRDIFRKEFAEEGLSGSIALVCKTCATRGRIRIQGTIQWSGFWPAAAYVDFIATDVQSEFLLQLLLNVKFDQADQVPLYQLGASVEVKNLFSASLLLGIGVGYEWSIEAEGSVEFGTRGKMRDGVQRTCFFGCSNSKSGCVATQFLPSLPPISHVVVCSLHGTFANTDFFRWSWDWQEQPTIANGSITVTTDIYMYINAQAGLTVMSYGFEGGLASLAPKFMAELRADASSNAGVCGHPHATLGVSVKLDIGIEVYLYSGSDFQDTDQEWPLFVWELNLFDRCWPLEYTEAANSGPMRAGTEACQYFYTPALKPWKPSTPQAVRNAYSVNVGRIKSACTTWNFPSAASWCVTAEVQRTLDEQKYAWAAAGSPSTGMQNFPWDYERGMIPRCAALARAVNETKYHTVAALLEGSYHTINGQIAEFFRPQDNRLIRDDGTLYTQWANELVYSNTRSANLCYYQKHRIMTKAYEIMRDEVPLPAVYASKEVFKNKIAVYLKTRNKHCKDMGEATATGAQLLTAQRSCGKVQEEAWPQIWNSQVTKEVRDLASKMNRDCKEGANNHANYWSSATEQCIKMTKAMEDLNIYMDSAIYCSDMRDLEIHKHGKPVDVAVDACQMLTDNVAFQMVPDKYTAFTNACTSRDFRRAALICDGTKPLDQGTRFYQRLVYQCDRLGRAAGTGLVAAA